MFNKVTVPRANKDYEVGNAITDSFSQIWLAIINIMNDTKSKVYKLEQEIAELKRQLNEKE